MGGFNARAPKDDFTKKKPESRQPSERTKKDEEQPKRLDETKPIQKPLEEKPVEKVASKTFYGVKPMEMAAKLDAENAKKMVSEMTDKTAELDNIEENPLEQKTSNQNMFGKGEENKTNSGKVFGSNAFNNPFGKATQPTVSSGIGQPQSNPTLAPAAFGQSSLGQASAIQDTQTSSGASKIGRTFGSAKQDKTEGWNTGTANSFLASGANKADDNEMAEEDIFGEGEPQQVNTGFANPTSFGQPQSTAFGQPSSSSNLQSSLGFDPKSNPSFTQRRK